MLDIIDIKINSENVPYAIYVSSFNNDVREKKMVERFEKVGVDASIYCYKSNDERVQKIIDIGGKEEHRRRNGCFYSILRMMEDFYNNSDKAYGVFCENDIYIHKELNKELINSCKQMQRLKLDVLLIGYLITCHPTAFGCDLFEIDENSNTYYRYNNELWGSHGFILTKSQAKFYIDKYTIQYTAKTEEIVSSDWVFTKYGNRALVYPPLVVEEGGVETDHYGQIQFHKRCADFLYNTNYI